MNCPSTARMITLPDGRVLEYFKCGVTDPENVIIATHGFYQTGFAFTLHCVFFKEIKTELISVTMPGFGYSDSVPYMEVRQITDWAKDIDHVLEKEKVDKFIALGYAAGAPHALNLLISYPKRAVAGLLLAPVSPMEVEAEIGAVSKMNYLPRFLRHLFDKPIFGEFLGFTFNILKAQTRLTVITDISRALKALNRQGKELARTYDYFMGDLDRTKLNTHRGLSENYKTLHTWTKSTMDLRKIKVPVLITTSEDDFSAPSAMARWVADALPKSKLRVFENGFGHLTSYVPYNFESAVRQVLTMIPKKKIESSEASAANQ